MQITTQLQKMPSNEYCIFLFQLNSYVEVINCTFAMKTLQTFQFFQVLYKFLWSVYLHWGVTGTTVHKSKSVLGISKCVMYSGYILWMSSWHIYPFIHRKHLQVTVYVSKHFPALRWFLAFHVRHCLAWKGVLASQQTKIPRKPRKLNLQTLKRLK